MVAYVAKGKIARALVYVGKQLYQIGVPALAVYTHAGAPTDGTSGTLAGIAIKGALLIDVTNATVYQNSNTLASPTWTIFTTASGAGAFTGTFDGVTGGVTPAAGSFTTLAGTDATDASSSTTGALKTAGGLGVAKAAYVGTNAIVLGATDASSSTTGSLKTAGGLGVAKKAYVGTALDVGTALTVGTTLNVAGVATLGSIDTALTAIGTDRAGSLALTKQFNNVTTVGATTAGVTLPAAAIGVPIWVWNNAAANAMHVYGAGSDTIDGVAGATGVVLAHAKSALFMCIAANTYLSSMGVLSA